MVTFSDIVDAADGLSIDEQEALLDILRRRIAERNRARLIRDVQEARSEFEAGGIRPLSVTEIMDEAQREA